MLNAYLRERIENWSSDFAHSDAAAELPAATRDYAAAIATAFLVAACEPRDIEPDEIEQPDARAALLEHVARLDLPASVRAGVPRLCGGLLSWLESEGRLSGGRVLGAFVAALAPAFEEAAGGKAKPFVRPGARIGRNDPCPCGSGKKYKKCCQRE
jgi:hypothetical protein